MCKFGINFIFQKFCLCKKNDKYEVWVTVVMVVLVMVVMKLVASLVFMGPKSDHCLALSDTESVTVSPLVDFCSI